MQSFFAGLALAIVGLVSAFFGYRLFRILLPIYGAVTGFVFAWGWLGESQWLLALIVGLGLGIILGILAYGIWSVLVGISGVILGLALAGLIASALGLWTWLAVVLAVVLAVALGILFVMIRNEMVIVLTGIVGAAGVARGVGQWLGVNGRFDAAGSVPVWLMLVMAALLVAVALLGIRYQWGRYLKLNLYGKAKADQGTPAPAATRGGQEIPVAAAATEAAAPAGEVGGPAVAAPVAAAVVAAELADDHDRAAAEVTEAAPIVEDAAAPAEMGTAAAAAAVATAAEAMDNKVEDALPTAEAEGVEGEEVAANVVDEVIKDIESTYSLDDIAKFKEKLEYVEGIGAAYAEKLRSAGLNTVLDLLQRGATRKGRLELVEATGITGKLILKWVNHADLYRIKGVGSEYADLLEAAGVDTVVELSHRNPANLLNTVVQTNKDKRLVRKEPVASQVEDWVLQAKQLPRVIQY